MARTDRRASVSVPRPRGRDVVVTVTVRAGGRFHSRSVVLDRDYAERALAVALPPLATQLVGIHNEDGSPPRRVDLKPRHARLA